MMTNNRTLDDHVWTAKMLGLLMSKDFDSFKHLEESAEQCNDKAKIVAYLQNLFKSTQLQSYQLFPALIWFFGDDLAKEIFYALDAITPHQAENHDDFTKRVQANELAKQVLNYQKH